jgi:GrpB-like predicted nucleotidyltransferase (UPF0157 family)/GNAT superfamily N-acetyltransferase
LRFVSAQYDIGEWTAADRDEVVNLILPIQQEEFGIAITADEQPDLLDVPGHYLAGGGRFWVARCCGDVVGSIAARVVDENTVAIRKMFVHRSTRGSGLAGQLMDTLVAWARHAGYRTLLLGTTSVMHGAQRFYTKHGFNEIDAAALPDVFPRMAVDSVFFRRDLLGVVAIRAYNPQWPELFETERTLLADALGDVAVRIEHTGSTAVPGLAAKPVIDITMAVPDSVDEARYVPALEAIGYTLTFREAEWFEHRLLNRDWPRVNLHVFSEGSTEITQMIGFRDWLRANGDDRVLYERVKRDLASRDWTIVQDYADAKSDIVMEIKRRAGLVPMEP